MDEFLWAVKGVIMRSKMIITEKQLICLMDVLKDTLHATLFDKDFSIDHEQRVELYGCIINQQSNKLQVIE